MKRNTQILHKCRKFVNTCVLPHVFVSQSVYILTRVFHHRLIKQRSSVIVSSHCRGERPLHPDLHHYAQRVSVICAPSKFHGPPAGPLQTKKMNGRSVVPNVLWSGSPFLFWPDRGSYISLGFSNHVLFRRNGAGVDPSGCPPNAALGHCHRDFGGA